MGRFAWSVVAVALAARVARAGALAVPVLVTERAHVARHGAPITTGVPLPKGGLHDPATVGLVGPAGHATPVQTKVLERWPDGSVRWLLLDFLADLPAGGHETYTLRPSAPAAAGPRLRMQAKDRTRIVDAGPLRLVVPPGGDRFSVELADGRHVGPIAMPALRLDGSEPVRFTPGGVTVETEGPVRTELLLTGRYAGDVAAELRVAVFAGQPLLRLEHTLTSLSDRHYVDIRSLALSIPGFGAPASVGVGGSSRPLTDALVEDDPTSSRVDGTPGPRADGWARASGPAGTLTLVAPWFWQEYPKAFRVTDDALGIDLFAGGDTPLRLGSGAAKTHEVWLSFAPGLDANELAAGLEAPPVAAPAPSWIVASRALPQALAPDTPAARDFLARLATAYDRYREQVRTERWDDVGPDGCTPGTPAHVRVGLYGVFNWGDWQFPGVRSRVHGCEAWGNLEYDLPQVLALGWLATGNPAFFDGLTAAARHYRDVDLIHHAPGHPEWVGMNHPHKSRHFAWETAEKVDLGHTWTEGLITYARLTGDVRALAGARGIADAIMRRLPAQGNPRQYGWPMLALVATWDATGESRYRDVALDYARMAMDTDRPTPDPRDWKMGILADGIAATHAATGDERLRRWLLAYADALLAAPARYTDARFWLPMGYVAALTGDPRYAARATAVAADLKIGNWGKPLAAMGRVGFRLLGPLETMPHAAPPPSTPRAPGKAPPRPAKKTPDMAPPRSAPPRPKPGVTRGRGAPRRPSARARRRPSRSPAAPVPPAAG